MFFGGLLWRQERLSVDLAGASSLPRAGCCPSTLLAQVRYLVPDVAMRCQSRRRMKGFK